MTTCQRGKCEPQRCMSEVPCQRDVNAVRESSATRPAKNRPSTELTAPHFRRTTHTWHGRRAPARRRPTPAADPCSASARLAAHAATSCLPALHRSRGLTRAVATTVCAATRSATTIARRADARSSARSATGSPVTQLAGQPPPPLEVEVERRSPLLSAAELALLRCDGVAEVPVRTWRVPRPSPISPVGALPAQAHRQASAPPRRQPRALSASQRPAAAPRARSTATVQQIPSCRHPGRVVGKCAGCPRRG